MKQVSQSCGREWLTFYNEFLATDTRRASYSMESVKIEVLIVWPKVTNHLYLRHEKVMKL